MKEIILSAAVDQLNDKGISKTTFRNIAGSLSLSDGHVRYYFKTKEELLLAVFDKMNTEILDISAQHNAHRDTLQNLRDKLIAAFSVMVNYSFFFTETPATYQQFPKLAALYTELLKSRKQLFLTLFQNLTLDGFFNSSFSGELQQKAFYSIFIVSDSWIRYYTILNNAKPDREAVAFHADIALSILLPYIKN